MPAASATAAVAFLCRPQTSHTRVLNSSVRCLFSSSTILLEIYLNGIVVKRGWQTNRLTDWYIKLSLPQCTSSPDFLAVPCGQLQSSPGDFHLPLLFFPFSFSLSFPLFHSQTLVYFPLYLPNFVCLTCTQFLFTCTLVPLAFVCLHACVCMYVCLSLSISQRQASRSLKERRRESEIVFCDSIACLLVRSLAFAFSFAQFHLIGNLQKLCLCVCTS